MTPIQQEAKKRRWRRYYVKHREKLLERNRVARLGKEEYRKKYEKERYAKNPEFYKNKSKEYSKNNREKVNAYIRQRYATNLDFKLKSVTRSRLVAALKGQKKDRTMEIVGCSIDDLKRHLEAQFQPGMTWDNWSYKGWHIDHIVPLAVFDLSDETQLKRACHFTNLQPLWGEENHKKGSTLVDTDTAHSVHL